MPRAHPAAIALLATAAANAAPPADLFPGPLLKTDWFPVFAAVADLNNDAIPDIVVLTDDIHIHLGLGDRAFAPFTSINLNADISEAVITDLNNDGLPDIAIARSFDHTISVLLARPGIGSAAPASDRYAPAVAYPTGARPLAVAAADVNNDAIPDLITANYSDNTISVLLGLGDGSFTPRTDLPATARSTAIATGDLNADGRTDLAVASDFGITIFLADIAGSTPTGLLAGQPVLTDIRVTGIAIADTDADGVDDIVTTGPTGFVIPGNAPANWNPITIGPTDGTLVRTADINADTIPDLLYTTNRSTLAVRHGLGNAAFSPPILMGIGASTGSIALADLDTPSDNHPTLELITANYESNSVAIFSAGTDTPFNTRSRYPFATFPRATAAADFNNDGRADLAVATQNAITLLLANENGSLTPGQTIALTSTPNAIAAADINADHFADLAVTTADGIITIYLNQGDATLAPNGTLTPAGDLFFADLDNDGLTDLTTGSVIFRNTGNAVFAPPATVPSVGGYIVLADFNNDQRPDFAGVGADNLVRIALSDQTGTLRPPTIIDTGAIRITDLAAADLDQDGLADLVVTDSNNTPNNSSVRVLRALGLTPDGPAFAPPAFYPTGFRPHQVGVADFDNDGIPDIVTLNRIGNSLSFLRGRGDATFLPRRDFATHMQPGNLLIADFNADMTPDIAATSVFGPNDITVLLSTPPAPAAPCPADLNNDAALNANDLIAFIEAFQLGLPAADINADNSLDFRDLTAFLAAFAAGCP